MAWTRLGGEDAAWLHMEDAANPMVVSGIVDLAARLPMTALTERVAQRLASIARFRERVVEPPLGLGPPHWEPDPRFDVREHLEHAELEAPDDATLQAFIGKAVSRLLDRSRPLWHITAIDRPGAGTTLLFRVHHAIADGFALLSALLSLCDEGPSVASALPLSVKASHGLRRYAAAARRIVVLPPDPKTSLKGALGNDKRVAWSAPLALPLVKDVAHREGATVNDVRVAVVAGALRRELRRRGDDVMAVRAMVPVNLRVRPSSAELGNRFGLVILELPVGIADGRERVAAVHARMGALKATREPVVTFAILRLMGWAPRAAESLGVAFFGKKASLVLTNVPGPRERLHMTGVDVTRVLFWVPQSGRMGLGISIFSYADAITVGVMADALLMRTPERLAADVNAEFADLTAGPSASPAVLGHPS